MHIAFRKRMAELGYRLDGCFARRSRPILESAGVPPICASSRPDPIIPVDNVQVQPLEFTDVVAASYNEDGVVACSSVAVVAS
jgi:hypothetical protein